MRFPRLNRPSAAKVFLIITVYCVLSYMIKAKFCNNRNLQTLNTKHVFHYAHVRSKGNGNSVMGNITKRTIVSVQTSRHPLDIEDFMEFVKNVNTKGNTVSVQKVLPFDMFRYPLDIDFVELVNNVSTKGTTDLEPINVFLYTYLKPIESICESTNAIFLLFMIKSAPGNFDQRQIIRETWTSRVYFKQNTVRHIFLLARTMNKTINKHLSLEKGTYHDIVEMSYVDDYYNNTYKTIGGINWCVRYCPKAKFVMLVDDDFYVATDLLLDYLHGLPNSTISSLFAGHVWHDVPQRGRNQKWYMSIEDYPFDKYPPFISAGATIMSMDFVKRLQIAIQFTKRFRFDDVFLAIVAYKLGVKPINHPGINIMKHISYNDEEFKTVVASHGYGNPNDLRTAWHTHVQTIKYK